MLSSVALDGVDVGKRASTESVAEETLSSA